MTRPRGGFFSRLLRTITLSNMYAALGFAALSQCAALLMGLPLASHIFSFFFFQTLAIHLFRDFTLGRTVKFNAPDRQYFMEKYKKPLLVLGGLSFLIAGWGAFMEDGRLRVIMALMWFFACIYQFLPRPRGYADWNLPRLILRPSFLAVGWGAAMLWAAAPLDLLAARPAAAILSLGAVAGHVFVLSVMEDVRGAQGDQIFGRPSLPLFLDEPGTQRALTAFLALWLFWLVMGAASLLPPLLSLLMAVSGPLYGCILMKPLFRHPYGYMFEAAMYGQLILNLPWVFLYWALS